MKDKFSRLINKNLKLLLIVAIVIVMAFGTLLVLISGNDEDRDQVPIDPTAEQTETKEKKERKLAVISDHPGVSDIALNMYNTRVDDISDTAQVAQLLESTDMRAQLGDYLVTLKLKDDKDILIITFEKELKAGEDTAFDEIATWYAQQLLALVEEADEVQWSYKIEKDQAEIAEEKEAAEKEAAEKAAKEAEKKKKDSDEDSDKEEKDSDEDKNKDEEEIVIDKLKTVEKSLTLEQANEMLNTDNIKDYSETPEMVQTLLNNQKGIV